MARSGIEVSEELRKQFVELQEGKTGWIKVTIDEDSTAFKKIAHGDSSGTDDGDWKNIQAQLGEKEPTYVFARLPSKEGKWLLVFHCPEKSKAKSKMLYSSSSFALKKGFGFEKFLKPDTFRTAKASEACAKEYARDVHEVDEEEIMTSEERLAEQAHNDSAMSMAGTKVSAVMGVPVKVKSEATSALGELKAGKINTVILRLNPETEVLEEAKTGDHTFEEIGKLMTRTDPRYIVHNFRHEKDEKTVDSLVFFYYCPDSAKPRLKMFYSSCKAMIVKVCEEAGLEVKKLLEGSEASELTSGAVLDELYPKATVKKTFAKPKARGGKGPRRMAPGTKFSSAGGETTSPSSASSPTSAEPTEDDSSL